MTNSIHKWEVSVTSKGGYLVDDRFFTEKSKAREFFVASLAKYLDYDVVMEKINE